MKRFTRVVGLIMGMAIASAILVPEVAVAAEIEPPAIVRELENDSSPLPGTIYTPPAGGLRVDTEPLEVDTPEPGSLEAIEGERLEDLLAEETERASEAMSPVQISEDPHAPIVLMPSPNVEDVTTGEERPNEEVTASPASLGTTHESLSDASNGELREPQPTVVSSALPSGVASTVRIAAPPTGCPVLPGDPYAMSIMPKTSSWTTPVTNNQPGKLLMRVENLGTNSWPAGTVLSYRLANSTQTGVGFGSRTTIAQAVPAGTWIELPAQVGKLAPGDWYLAWDLEIPGKGWASDLGACTMTMKLTVQNQAPSISDASPSAFATVTSRVPFLAVDAKDVDAWPAPVALRYSFKVCKNEALTDGCISSGAQAGSSWQVPSGALEWSSTYFWSFEVSDGIATTSLLSTRAPLRFTVVVPTPDDWRRVGAGLGMANTYGLVLPYGTFVHSEKDIEIPVANLPLTIERTYSSGAATTEGSFGLGWMSVFDSAASYNPEAGTLSVIYPDGRQESFGKQANGTYIGRPEMGVTNRVQTNADRSLTVTQSSGEIVAFDSAGKIARIEFVGAGKWTFSYGASGRVSRVTQQPSGRFVDIAWEEPQSSVGCSSGTKASRPHVSTISVPQSSGIPALKWLYSYSCARLSSMTNAEGGVTKYSTTATSFSAVSPEGRTSRGLKSVGSWTTVQDAHQERKIEISEPGAAPRIVTLYRPTPGGTWDEFYREVYNPLGGIEAEYCEDRSIVGGVEQCGAAKRSMEFDTQGRLRVLAKRQAASSDQDGVWRTWYYGVCNPANPITCTGALEGMRDENEHVIAFTYDGWGNPTGSFSFRGGQQITSSSGYKPLSNAANADTRLSSVSVSPRQGNPASPDMFSYDPQGRLTKRTSAGTPAAPTGEEQTYSYTTGTEAALGPNGLPVPGTVMPAGLLRTASSPAGTTTYGYNARGDQVQTTDASGGRVLRTFDVRGLVGSETVMDSEGRSSTKLIDYDKQGRVAHEYGPCVKNVVTGQESEHRIDRSYDRAGLPTSVKERAVICEGDSNLLPERVTSFSYTNRGELAKQVDAANGVTTYTYSTVNPDQLVGVQDARGRKTKIEYLIGLEKTIITSADVGKAGASAMVPIRVERYDVSGRLSQETDALSRTTEYYYTDDNLVWKSTLKTPGAWREEILWTREFDGAGRITRSVEGNDNVTRTTEFLYDSEGRLVTSVLDPGGLNRRFTTLRDTAGRTIGESITANGLTERTTYEVDSAGAPIVENVWINGSEALTTRTKRSSSGLITGRTDPRGYETNYAHDAVGQLVTIINPAVDFEELTSLALSESGAPAEVRTDTERPRTSIGYNAFGDVTEFKDARGNIETYEFDSAGRHIKTVRAPYIAPDKSAPVSSASSIRYSVAGDVTQTISASGGITDYEYEYDLAGNVTRVVNPSREGGRPAVSMTYDAANQVVKEQTDSGREVEKAYDMFGRVVSTTEFNRLPGHNFAGSYRSEYQYDILGNLTMTMPRVGPSMQYKYNAAGEKISERVQNRSKVKRFEYDLAGRPTKSIDEAGRTQENQYDGAGRLISETSVGTDGSRTRQIFGYDKSGNLISAIDGRGVTTRSSFDEMNRLRQIVRPISEVSSAITSFGYDLSGNRTRVTNARNLDTWTVFNEWDLPEAVLEPATASTTGIADRSWVTSFDNAGNAIREMKPGNVVVTREFDVVGQLTAETGEAQTSQNVVGSNRSFQYDLDGRMTKMTADGMSQRFEWDDFNNLLSTSSDRFAESYEHNRDGSILHKVSRVGTGPSTSSNFEYDDEGKVTSLWDGRFSSSTQAYTNPISFEYDSTDGKLVGKSWVTGSTDISYDSFGRTQRMVTANSSGETLEDIRYERDGNGNVTSEKLLSEPAAGGLNGSSYEYDQLNRLVVSQPYRVGVPATTFAWDKTNNRTAEKGRWDKSWTYDDRGRMTGGTVRTGPVAETISVVTSPSGSTTSIESDERDTRELRYNAFDQPVRDGDTAYKYDALGRLAERDGAALLYKGLELDPFNVPGLLAGGEAAVRGPAGELLGTSTVLGFRAPITNDHGDLIGGQVVGGAQGAQDKKGSTSLDAFGAKPNPFAWDHAGMTHRSAFSSLETTPHSLVKTSIR